MKTGGLSLICVSMLLLSASVSGCGSGSGESRKDSARSSPESGPALSINDSDWELRLISRLPEKEEARRLRCNAEKLCWVWDSQSIWVGRRENGWQQFYALSPEQAKDSAWIRSVHLLSTQSGWMVKDRALYKTVDAGRNWTSVSLPQVDGGTDWALFSIYFQDSNHGWAAGGLYEPMRKDDPAFNTAMDRGRILVSSLLETTDGGVTWQRKALPRIIGGFEEIYFWNDKIGMAFDLYQTGLVFTNDGGKSWTEMTRRLPVVETEPEESATIRGAFFLDQNQGWILTAGFGFEVLTTWDGGKSWKQTTWKIVSESADTASYPPPPQFGFSDKKHGLFIYNHTEGSELFKTSDAGKTWQMISGGKSEDEKFSDLFFTENGGGLMVGRKGIYTFSLH